MPLAGQDANPSPAVQALSALRANKNILRIGLSLIAILLLFWVVDLQDFAGVFSQIRLPPLAGGFCLLVLSQYLSSLRFFYVLKDNDIHISWREANRANIYGLIGGLFFFNILGQGMTRVALLSARKVPQSTIFLITVLERLAAMAVLVVAAAIGLVVLFQRISLSVESGGILLLRNVAAVCLIGVFVLLVGLTRRQRRLLGWLLGQIYSKAMLRLLLVTVAMHACTLAAYVVIAVSLRDEASLMPAMAASAIVMLVASLPISFAGWGLRELSASLAFARIGFTPEQGLFVGVAIGILAILALIGHAIWVGIRDLQRRPQDVPAPTTLSAGLPLEKFTYWLIGIGASAAALIHILVPTNTGYVNVNLGDPFALIGGLIWLSLALRMRSLTAFWRDPGIARALGAITLVLVFALVRGYWIYGPIDWALVNRFAGWFVLLGYFTSGTLLVAAVGPSGLSSMGRVLVSAAAAVTLWEVGTRILAHLFGFNLGQVPEVRAAGLAGNPNAFSFQLLMGFVAIAATAQLQQARFAGWQPILLTGFVLAGLWLSGSRAGYGTLAVLVAVFFVMAWNRGSGRAFASNLAASAAVAAFIVLAPLPIAAAMKLLFAIDSQGLMSGYEMSFDVQIDRIESFLRGFEMWLRNPLLGAGLGVFIHEYITANGIPLVIHNSFLWIAAELGTIGLVAFGMLAYAVIRSLPRLDREANPDALVIIVGIAVTMAMMSMVHDMLYQRLFWLLLGAAVAVPYTVRRARQSG